MLPTGEELCPDDEAPGGGTHEVKWITGDERDAWKHCRRENRHIRWSHNLCLNHAVAPRIAEGLDVNHLSDLDAPQAAEEPIAMPGNGCIACGIDRRGALDVAGAPVEFRGGRAGVNRYDQPQRRDAKNSLRDLMKRGSAEGAHSSFRPERLIDVAGLDKKAVRRRLRMSDMPGGLEHLDASAAILLCRDAQRRVITQQDETGRPKGYLQPAHRLQLSTLRRNRQEPRVSAARVGRQ